MNVHKVAPTINLDGVWWLRSVHSTQDSKLKINNFDHVSQSEARLWIRAYTSLDHIDLDRAFAAL